jgi:hypothetical protein
MREMGPIPEDGNLSQPPGVLVVNHGQCGPIRALAGHARVEIARRKPLRFPGVGCGPSRYDGAHPPAGPPRPRDVSRTPCNVPACPTGRYLTLPARYPWGPETWSPG